MSYHLRSAEHVDVASKHIKAETVILINIAGVFLLFFDTPRTQKKGSGATAKDLAPPPSTHRAPPNHPSAPQEVMRTRQAGKIPSLSAEGSGVERRGEEMRGAERSGEEWSGVEWSRRGAERRGVEWRGEERSGKKQTSEVVI